MQWHDRIKEAPGECRSDAWWTYQLGKRLKAMAEASGLPRDEGLRSLTWLAGNHIKSVHFVGNGIKIAVALNRRQAHLVLFARTHPPPAAAACLPALSMKPERT